MFVKIQKKHLLLAFVVLFLVVVPFASFAQEDEGGGVHLLQGGFISGYEENPSLGTYLGGLFNVLLGVATALAVVMMTIGGITYMITGSIQKKEDGLEMVKQALYGLLLAIAAWLILSTINPDLVKFDLAGAVKTGAEQTEDSSGN